MYKSYCFHVMTKDEELVLVRIEARNDYEAFNQLIEELEHNATDDYLIVSMEEEKFKQKIK